MERLEELQDATRWLVEEAEHELEAIKKSMNGEPVAELPPPVPEADPTPAPQDKGLATRLTRFLPALLKG